MTTTTDLLDPELEARLRALLQEQARTITGPAPDLPRLDDLEAVERVAPLAEHPGRRHGGRRWAVALVAAACLALVGAAVVLAGGDDPSTPAHVVATQPSVPAALGADHPVPLFHATGTTSPEEAAQLFLRVRLGDGSAETDATLRDELDLESGTPVTADGRTLIPVQWTRSAGSSAGPATTNTVWVRPGPDGADVVAATTPGIDLDGVEHQQGKLTGTIRASSPADGYGRTTVATLTRSIAMPLLEPDAAVAADAREPVAATVPVGTPFSVPIEASGDLELTVRVVDGRSGDVVGLAMATLPAPPDPAMEGFEDLTPAEQAEVMRGKIPVASDSPACKEAGAFRMPELGGFPNEVPAKPAAPTTSPAGEGPAPAEAIVRLGTSLSLSWEVADVQLAGLDGAYAIARLPNGRLVDLTLYRRQGAGDWRVTEARTRGACRDFGGSNATPVGAANPKTTLGLPVVAGAVAGDVRYRSDGEARWVEVDEHDLATHWINVAAEQGAIDLRTTVLRDASGQPVLVDLSQGTNVPG